MTLDPRYFQIASLATLSVIGITRLDFEVTLFSASLIIWVVLATQYVGGRLVKLPFFDPKSALISALSLCLLLRSNSPWLLVAGALATIAGKFLIRWNGKHVFNPTNFGIVLLLLATDSVWVSAGQWGSYAFFGFLFACLGILTVTRAKRADVTLAFLFFYGLILFGRSYWLGEPISIPLHRVQNGGLLLFSFFMISDPKTTPNSRAGRILFAFLVAFGAGYVQFKLFRTNGLLWSLAFWSVFVPFIDKIFSGPLYSWTQLSPSFSPKGDSHEKTFPLPDSGRGIPEPA